MGFFYRSSKRSGYFREDWERHDLREFRALRRRLNFLENELSDWDGNLSEMRGKTGTAEFVHSQDVLMRNYSDEAAEIVFIINYFDDLRRGWPRAYYWVFGVLVSLSVLLSLMALMR